MIGFTYTNPQTGRTVDLEITARRVTLRPQDIGGVTAEEEDAALRSIRYGAETLNALRWAMHHVENVFALAGRDDRERADLELARAALAKAEGR